MCPLETDLAHGEHVAAACRTNASDMQVGANSGKGSDAYPSLHYVRRAQIGSFLYRIIVIGVNAIDVKARYSALLTCMDTMLALIWRGFREG